MESQKRIIDAISEISRANAGMLAYERQLETSGAAWLEDIENRVNNEGGDIGDAILDLTSILESLLSISGSEHANQLIGRALTLLVDFERRDPRSQKIMRRLLGRELTEKAQRDRRPILAVKPGFASTEVAYFEGVEKIHETEIHLSPDLDDTVDSRVEEILDWLDETGIDLGRIVGIGSRCGFVKPIPTGSYRIVPEMLHDLETPRITHETNKAIAMTLKIAEKCGGDGNLVLTASDPVVSDEIETVERLTGFLKIKRDGSGAHYLNHRAIIRLLYSLLGKNPGEICAITAHLGNGMSLALHRNDTIPAIVDAFSGIPTTNRCGPVDLPRILEALKNDDLTFKELEAITFSRGGLLSLAGTNDFRALEGFRHKGASPSQQEKIDMVFEFFARQITAAIFKLTSDGKPVDVIALAGGIARSQDLVHRIQDNIDGRFPLLLIPGSLELESLAAGNLRGFYEPDYLKDYVRERDALQEKHRKENQLLDTVIFERQVIYRHKDSPILGLDELIDATRVVVRDKFLPSIAIVGAENEEAILAAKRANEEGNYRIAKFHLVGDFAAINEIAYDFDLVIDNDNYIIHDTDNAVEEAVKLVDAGEAHIFMKGGIKTEKILKGVFQYLKSSGRIKKGELMSHVFVMDIPVRNKLLLITDAAVNTYPDEEKRVKIIENALRVAKHLNIKRPKVAVVSAVENVNQSIESSIAAERIAERFRDRDDCYVEGPLSFDVAMDQKIALEKHYRGVIRGTADILIMPDIDAGNVLYKSLTTQSGATSAGVIVCGDMPMVLTSRGDSARSKLASISLAVKMFLDMQGGT